MSSIGLKLEHQNCLIWNFALNITAEYTTINSKLQLFGYLKGSELCLKSSEVSIAEEEGYYLITWKKLHLF